MNGKSKELAKNTIVILIGTICTKFLTFLLLPLYTGILNTDEYGTFDLITTLVSLLFPIITFQIEQAVFRELIDCRYDDSGKKNIISSSFFCVLLQCLLCICIFIIISFFITNKYKFYLLLFILTSIFSSLILQISRGIGNNKLFAKGSFVNSVVTVIFNVIFLVLLKLRVEGLLLGQILGQIVCILYLFYKLNLNKYISRKNVQISSIKKMWKYSIPLIPNAVSWWIFGSSDKVIVSAILGLSMNGLLAAATKIASVYTILYNVFDRSWMESISLHINDNDIEEYFNRMFNEILKIFISLLILIISSMPFVYNVLINNKFIEGYKLVPILLIAALFNVIQGLIASIYAAKKNTKSIAKTSLVAAVVNIIIHLGLIKFIGVYAAVVSTLGSYFIISIYRFFDIRKNYLKIKIDKKMLFTSMIILMTVVFVYYYNKLVSNIISFICSSILLLIYNKNTLNFIKNIIKNRKREN